MFTFLDPVGREGRQYILHWYIAETVPPLVEDALNEAMAAAATPENPTPYQVPPLYPSGLTLEERVKIDKQWTPKTSSVGADTTTMYGCYKPKRHENTGVNEDEDLYLSALVPIQYALGRLEGSGMDWVVRTGWQLIRERAALEKSWSLERGKASS